MDPQTDTLLQALRLAAIVEGSDDAIIGKDVNGIITSWNAAAERTFGYTAAEAIGRSIRMIIPADRQSEEDMVLSRVRAGERVEHFETIRCRKDGTLFDVSITVSPMRTPDGRIVGASTIVRDISEHKRIEQALADARAEQSELRRRLSGIIDASGALLLSPRFDDVLPALLTMARQALPADAVAVWRIDGARWRIAASDGLGPGFAATSFAMTPAPIADLVLCETIDDPWLGVRRDAYAAEGIVSMLDVPLQVGNEVKASVSFYYRTPHQFSAVERGTAQGLARLASAAIAAAALYDTQERRRLESEFVAEAGAILVSALNYRDTLARLAQRVVPQLADWCAFYLHAEDGSLQEVAAAAAPPAARERLGAFARAADGEPDDAFSVERVVRTGVALLVPKWSVEDSPPSADERKAIANELGLASLMIVPMVAHGRSVGALALGSLNEAHRFGGAELRFAQDLAYRAALSIDNILSYEEARKANRLKDEFLANLSHELRTPLNAIVGYAQMLRKGAMPEDRRARAFEVLDKNASALTQIVEDVLDISRIVSGKIRLKPEPVRVVSIVRHSIETVQPGADAKGIQIVLDADDDRTMVAGDPDRLQQVFWNLLSNAVKFTPRSGRVDVRVGHHEHASEVLVTDNGAGIDASFLPHIFERFRQGDTRYGREHGGLGLGLAIARQIVEMHGGTITAESDGVGKGATFRVVLPAHPA